MDLLISIIKHCLTWAETQIKFEAMNEGKFGQFNCEMTSMLKQDAFILITCSSKAVQSPETMPSK